MNNLMNGYMSIHIYSLIAYVSGIETFQSTCHPKLRMLCTKKLGFNYCCIRLYRHKCTEDLKSFMVHGRPFAAGLLAIDSKTRCGQKTHSIARSGLVNISMIILMHLFTTLSMAPLCAQCADFFTHLHNVTLTSIGLL